MAEALDSIVEQLKQALQAQQQIVASEREQVASEREKLQRESAMLEASHVKVADGDLIDLNVGGRLLTTTRRTLCLVTDSLLATMFSGRWADGVTRDGTGRFFLDLDPDLFDLVLGWLRFFAIAPPSHSVTPEPAVPPGKTEAMMALLDYLCLHRHIPVSYTETFSDALHSPGVLAAGDTACRAAERGGERGGARAQRALLVAAGQHAYFDLRVEFVIEVIEFAHSMPDGKDDFAPQFIGVMTRRALEEMDLGDTACKPTWQQGCYGWWTGGEKGFQIADGVKARHPAKEGLLWHQGDHLEITIDCRRSLPHCVLGLHNTVTGQRLQIETTPRPSAGTRQRQQLQRHRQHRQQQQGQPPVHQNGLGPGPAAAAAAGAAAPAAAHLALMPPPSPAPVAANAAAAQPRAGVADGAAEAAGGGGGGGGQDAAGGHASSTLQEWLLVVGLSGAGDKLRINKARRRGMRPE